MKHLKLYENFDEWDEDDFDEEEKYIPFKKGDTIVIKPNLVDYMYNITDPNRKIQLYKLIGYKFKIQKMIGSRSKSGMMFAVIKDHDNKEIILPIDVCVIHGEHSKGIRKVL